MSNTQIKADITPSEHRDFVFPETTPELLSRTNNCGICFSGGGTRSMAATMGQLRALHKLGLLAKARYISSVSGGSWALPFIRITKTNLSMTLSSLEIVQTMLSAIIGGKRNGRKV